MKILLVEDEEEIGGLIKDGLEKEEFSVDYCKDGDSGMEHAMAHSYLSLIHI